MTTTFSNSFFNCQTLSGEIALLEAKRKKELAVMHTLFNARLQLWSEQFTDMAPPQFDGTGGFGFEDRFKNEIHQDELLVGVDIENTTVKATFDPGVYHNARFTMTLPLRYLDAETGEAAIVRDANYYKRALSMESSPSP